VENLWIAVPIFAQPVVHDSIIDVERSEILLVGTDASGPIYHGFFAWII